MRDPVELMADTLRERREVPVTVRRRCVQAAAEIARLIEKRDYLRDDFKVRTLTEDLHEAVRRIPDAVPVVAEELATRVPQAMIALGPADLARLRTVVNQVMDVSDPEVVEMIAPGLSVLERHAEGERLSDEVERMHVYALGWMLFDVSRLVRDFGALRARLVSGADQMDKLSAAINAASQLYHILLRLFV